MPVSFTIREVLVLIKKNRVKINRVGNAFQLSKQILRCVRDRIRVGGQRFWVYIYLDEKRHLLGRCLRLRKKSRG